jgi:hypothetical protein
LIQKSYNSKWRERGNRKRREKNSQTSNRVYETACGEVVQLIGMISYKISKTDNWPQLKTWAQMIEVWNKIKMWPDEELLQSLTENDEKDASVQHCLLWLEE